MRAPRLTRRRLAFALAVLAVAIAVACVVALSFGSEHVSFAAIWSAAFDRLAGRPDNLTPEETAIVFGLRLPRLALALLVGASLSIAGAAFQALLRNPLAEPYILGVSSGAALGAVLSVVYLSAFPFSRTPAAFAGAIVTIGAVYALGGGGESAPTERLILAGVIVNAFLGSTIIFLLTLASDSGLRGIYSWLIGDLSGATTDLAPVAVVVAVGVTCILLSARSLNLMMLGERDAAALGVSTARVKLVVYLAASLVTGAAVAVSGMIGFVGLIVPHAVRLVVGSDNRLVIPASALVGAAFLALADTVARTMFAPREIHIGVITALVGAPAFIFLLEEILVITAERIVFRYGHGDLVLRDVSCAIVEGEVLALAGPNGSGKSTLIGVLGGLLRPTSGTVSLDGKPIRSLSRREIARFVGLVAQSGEFHFPFTVLEYVLQGRFAHGRLLGFESEEDVAAAHRALDMTATAQFAGRRIDELSGGERQRIMLARALAQEPRALLLDEPTANLDISHQVRMLDLVRSLAHGCGMAVAVVTHDLNLAAEFADRMLVLGAGEVRGVGAPRDVLSSALIEAVFEAPVVVDSNPVNGAPRVTVVAPREHRGANPDGVAK